MPHRYVYIWTDASGNFRSKVRYISDETPPNWNYDGSSTGQATTDDSEIELVPLQTYTGGYVLCATYRQDGTATTENTYAALLPGLKRVLVEKKVRVAFEQEFFIYDERTRAPLHYDAWHKKEQGPYYCSVGAGGNGFIEKYLSAIFDRAVALGIQVTGYNLEVAPAQGEIQVDAYGIRAAHDLTMLRYLMWDTLGEHGLYPVFDPKPLGPDWNGSGLHTNISTCDTMDTSGGLDAIHTMLRAMGESHKDWMPFLGAGNEQRLTGIHETSSYTRFTMGVGSRSTSVRIPNSTYRDGRGYFEDRRPAANADPYVILCRYAWLIFTSINV